MLLEIHRHDALTASAGCRAHGNLRILLVRAAAWFARHPRKKAGSSGIPRMAPNPATATMAGYAVGEHQSNDRGMVDVEALARLVDEDVAALMITNPNTLGVFERHYPHR